MSNDVLEQLIFHEMMDVNDRMILAQILILGEAAPATLLETVGQGVGRNRLSKALEWLERLGLIDYLPADTYRVNAEELRSFLLVSTTHKRYVKHG